MYPNFVANLLVVHISVIVVCRYLFYTAQLTINELDLIRRFKIIRVSEWRKSWAERTLGQRLGMLHQILGNNMCFPTSPIALHIARNLSFLKLHHGTGKLQIKQCFRILGRASRSHRGGYMSEITRHVSDDR
jgi:hypothetical protein